MTFNRKLTIATILLLSLALAACGGGEQEASSAVLTQAAQIYSDSLTQTAAVAPPTATATVALPTATNTPMPPTFTPTVTGTPPTNTPLPPTQPATGGNTGGGSSSSGAGCYRASLNFETIPDGTQLDVGQSFKKVWMMKNIGTCTWDANTLVRFIEGDLMGAEASQAISEEPVLPGETVRIEVNMVAPDTQGTYKGYWMLVSGDGTIFGLGGDGRAWFWVEIFAKN